MEVGDRPGRRKSVCPLDVKHGAQVDTDEFTELLVLVVDEIGAEVEAPEQLGELDSACKRDFREVGELPKGTRKARDNTVGLVAQWHKDEVTIFP